MVSENIPYILIAHLFLNKNKIRPNVPTCVFWEDPHIAWTKVEACGTSVQHKKSSDFELSFSGGKLSAQKSGV